jgi:hypothetical protein
MNNFIKKCSNHLHSGTFLRTVRNLINQAISKLQWRCRTVARDLFNRIKYGNNAPKYGELIWVDATKIERFIFNDEIKRILKIKMPGRSASGRVVDWESLNIRIGAIETNIKIKYCYKHWQDGFTWEELGYYDCMASTPRHCNWSKSMIIERFRMLDSAFETIKQTGVMKTRSEIDPNAYREEEGVLIHIDEYGKPILGSGFHRFTIAKVLKLKKMPACIGIVSHKALPFLDEYRNPPDL